MSIKNLKNKTVSQNVKGVLFLIASLIFFVCVDSCIKHVGVRLHVFEIVFFRCVLGILLLSPYFFKKGFFLLKTNKYKFYFLRLSFGISNMMLLFYALTNLSLAFVTTLTLASPIFMIFLASFLLGEKTNTKRKIATITGFLGIVVVLRPSGEISLPALAALSCAILYSVTTIYIKKLSQTENKFAMLMWFMITASILSFFLMQPFWLNPTKEEILFLTIAAFFGILAQFFTIKAYEIGKATFIAPFGYFKILIAITLGFIFFGEVPDIFTLLGAVIIILSSYVILDKKKKHLQEDKNN